MNTPPKDKVFSRKITLNLNGKIFRFDGPKVMGIVNLTTDSFYPGSRFLNEKDLLNKAGEMLEQGAAFIDLGAASTRPGADEIEEPMERERIVKAVSALVKTFPDAVLSVDTYRSSVARAGVEAGAAIINDIAGGNLDEKMFETVASLGVPYILMHMRGTAATMAGLNDYKDVTLEVIHHFHKKIANLRALGVKDVILDPGFGFAKNIKQNFTLLKELGDFAIAELPLLVGISRKSMIYKTLGVPVEETLAGTIALNMIALQNGADIIRVHDVKEAVQAVKLFKEVYS
jgi:dihydropteroate synthase